MGLLMSCLEPIQRTESQKAPARCLLDVRMGTLKKEALIVSILIRSFDDQTFPTLLAALKGRNTPSKGRDNQVVSNLQVRGSSSGVDCSYARRKWRLCRLIPRAQESEWLKKLIASCYVVLSFYTFIRSGGHSRCQG